MGESSASGREAGFLNVRTVTWHRGSYGPRLCEKRVFTQPGPVSEVRPPHQPTTMTL